MAVVTISREIGSGGDKLARLVAERLGYSFVDKRFIEHLLGQYGFVEFEQEYASIPTFWQKFDAQKETRRDEMVKLLNRAILAIAQRGDVVILGRSGYIVLGDYADVLHVRVQAPEALRSRRIAAHDSVTLDEAVAKVRQVDKVRQAFVAEFYGREWQDAHVFDLLINTGKVTPELAASWVVAAAQALDDAEISAGLAVEGAGAAHNVHDHCR